MIKFSLSLIYSLVLFLGLKSFFGEPKTTPADPSELTITPFAGPDVTPSPACLAVAPTGEVFVGVDMIGSLGKDPNKGRILKLVDKDNDGKMDQHSEFAIVDNPRGIIAQGNQVFVLHTTFSKETGKATGMDLVVFEDKDGDGKADGPAKPLIEHISNAKYIQERGTDHATNGIRLGIDGWIYIAVGDFGFHDAVDRSGKKMTMLGGGVGMDNIDVEYARSKGVAVVNTPAASSLSVAELVFAHLFTGIRFLQDSNRKMPVEGATKFNAAQ